MGKTFRTARPNPDYNIPADRAVKESTARRFVKAVKKIAHHRERRRATAFISRQMEEAI